MANKLIGIFGWKVTENSYGVTLPYLQLAEQFGDVKILGINEPISTDLDLVIVPGGADVNPSRYGATPNYYTGKSDPIKEYQDTVILPQYIALGIPIFGICRGMQTLAVHFGAKLIQNMYHETNENDRDDLVHNIDILTSSLSIRFTSVNSMHHQCVSNEDLPRCLEVIGVYAGKNKNVKKYRSSIEIIKHTELPIWGVQYHPEELSYDPISDEIISKLLTNKEVYEIV